MILSDFLKAVGQIGDPAFRRVLALGVALSLALLVGVFALLVFLIQAWLPDVVVLPFIGPVGGIETLLGWGSAVLMILASVVLMVPVASAFTGFFLDQVASAVEARHYPGLPAVTPARMMDTAVETVNFLGLVIAVNLLALLAYVFAGPAAPFVFWSVNGYLLGREYFTTVAARRLGRDGARALRRQHGGQIWLAGILMAAPLSVPFVNLVIPVIGIATFTHLFHRLQARG